MKFHNFYPYLWKMFLKGSREQDVVEDGGQMTVNSSYFSLKHSDENFLAYDTATISVFLCNHLFYLVLRPWVPEADHDS